MRQVPAHQASGPVYGLIGDGRLATHLAYYLSSLNIPYTQWSRKVGARSGQSPGLALQECTVVLLAIKDSAIKDFVASTLGLSGKILVHFSGAMSFDELESCHPLMTFGKTIYAVDVYRQIPFVLEKGRRSFAEIFPALENPHYYISTEMKSFYHSLCVLSGNFTTILWQKFFRDLNGNFGIPAEAAFLYLRQTMMNVIEAPEEALTGPLARRDLQTIEKNWQALTGDPFQKIYSAFASALVPGWQQEGGKGEGNT